jgi:DNA-binding MarR family transcriptional regulator
MRAQAFNCGQQISTYAGRVEQPTPLITNLPPDQERAWFSLLRVHAQVMRHVEADLMRRNQITFSSAEILCHLRIAAQPQPVNDLAGQLVSVSATRASRLIQNLVEDGYIVRSSDQAAGRISLLKLTASGEKFARTVSNTVRNAIAERFVAALDEEDLAAMARIWQKIAAAES